MRPQADTTPFLTEMALSHSHCSASTNRSMTFDLIQRHAAESPSRTAFHALIRMSRNVRAVPQISCSCWTNQSKIGLRKLFHTVETARLIGYQTPVTPPPHVPDFRAH